MNWESGKAMVIGLLRGTGYGLGAHASKYAQEDRSMLRVLRDQARSRPDHPWLIRDQVDQLSFGQGWNLVNQIGNAFREWCEKALPKYMVPRYFEQRLSFQKTTSERIEKYRIREDLLDRKNVFDAEGSRK